MRIGNPSLMLWIPELFENTFVTVLYFIACLISRNPKTMYFFRRLLNCPNDIFLPKQTLFITVESNATRIQAIIQMKKMKSSVKSSLCRPWHYKWEVREAFTYLRCICRHEILPDSDLCPLHRLAKLSRHIRGRQLRQSREGRVALTAWRNTTDPRTKFHEMGK
jgi:hypothetical protein